MSVTIRVNGLTICYKGSGGQHMNSAPDVCKTPDKGIPIPYSITASNPDLVKGTTTVKADGGNMIAIKPSEFSRCTGDEAGSMGGVVSGTNTKQSNWITFSPNVYAEGENICRLSDKLFMNNRNTVSGNGGQKETILNTTDPVLRALCEIFCEAREEWHACRGQPNCRSPSLRARDKVNAAMDAPGSRLSRALGNKIGAAERTMYAAGNALLDTDRKFYDQTGLRNAMRRAVTRASGNAALNRAGGALKRAWLRAVPGLNLLLTGADIYMTASDILDIIDAASDLMDNAVRIQPDFTSLNADGSVSNVYDFTFDAPGYQDSMSDDQRRLYQSTTGEAVKEIDNEACECDKRQGSPAGAIG